MTKRTTAPPAADADLAQAGEAGVAVEEGGTGSVLPEVDAGDPQGEKVDEGQAQNQGGGWDVEGDAVMAVDRMARLVDDLVLGKSQLVYDVRDFMVDVIKSRPKPWSGTPAAEQKDVYAACEHNARELIRRVVEIVASEGLEPVRVLLTKVNLGEKITITGEVKTFGDEDADKAVMTLHHARGKHVMLTVATVEDYAQNHRSEDVDQDEPDFSFEGESE